MESMFATSGDVTAKGFIAFQVHSIHNESLEGK